jgi:hypothetical protein
MQLDVVVTPSCPGGDEARRTAGDVAARFPGLSVRVIELGDGAGVPEVVVATPTYLLDGRVVALGNPGVEQLERAILARL